MCPKTEGKQPLHWILQQKIQTYSALHYILKEEKIKHLTTHYHYLSRNYN